MRYIKNEHYYLLQPVRIWSLELLIIWSHTANEETWHSLSKTEHNQWEDLLQSENDFIGSIGCRSNSLQYNQTTATFVHHEFIYNIYKRLENDSQIYFLYDIDRSWISGICTSVHPLHDPNYLVWPRRKEY